MIDYNDWLVLDKQLASSDAERLSQINALAGSAPQLMDGMAFQTLARVEWDR